MLENFGGLAGVRDRGLIEAAIARPYCGYYRSIAEKSAALLHSLALNHGFVDGNKRTAIYMVALLIYRSGYRMRFASQRRANMEMEEIVLAVVLHDIDFDTLVFWFRDRLFKA